MNKTLEKSSQMNMKERIYMLLQETMSQPKIDQVTCAWRKKLNQQVESKGNEKSYHAQIKPTEKKYSAIDHRQPNGYKPDQCLLDDYVIVCFGAVGDWCFVLSGRQGEAKAIEMAKIREDLELDDE